jgi:NodT family efflux transporter outer membrane factor (OMF) lipoprotein
MPRVRCKTFLRISATVGALGLGGCVVGPSYHPSPAAAPAAWASPLPGGFTEQGSAPSSWWASFNDAELDSLIERAAHSNLDLRVAEARVRQARAVRGASAADLLPELDGEASAARARQSANQPFFGALALPPNFPFEYSVYQAGFDASWELDLFGGKRRALEAATADWQGAIEARNDTVLSLLAEVGRNYVDLRGAQQRLGIAARNLTLQQEELELTRTRLRGGVATELDVTRAAALLANLQATIPPLESTARAAIYALAVLLGEVPGVLVPELTAVAALPPTPATVPIGLPSALLQRRPDVRRAERQLAAETARIGVAKADWFPKLSLTGDAGAESVSVSNWFTPGSRFWSIGPSLQWKALDFGRVRAEVHAQTAVQEAALASYQKAVLVALQEAETAIVAYAQEQNRYQALTDAQAQNRRSLDLADGLYQNGRVSFLDVLDARRTLYASDDQLALSQQSISVDLIALYKALGGGWEPLPQARSSAASTLP